MARLSELKVSFVKRNARKRGPTSSDAWNDQGEELALDLGGLSNQWNNFLVPLLAPLPDGTNDLNAFTSGLSGRTLIVDPQASISSNSLYYNVAKSRPRSLLEQLEDLYAHVNNSLEDLEAQITANTPSASSIPLADNASNFNASNVEDALAELALAVAKDHGALTGLADDDHPQYLPVDGSRPMSGRLNVPFGTTGAPGIWFGSESDCGIHMSASGQNLGFTYDGSSRFNVTFNSVSVVNVSTFSVDARIHNFSGVLQFGTSGSTSHSLGAGNIFMPGALEVDGTLWVDGALVAKRRVTPKTTNYPVVDTETREVYTNEGAGAEVNFTLPAAVAGLTYTFYVKAAQNLKITAVGDDTIRILTEVSAGAGNAVSNTVGSTVTLVAINATEWVALSALGTWTVT